MSEEEQKAIEYLKTYMLPYFGEGKEVEFYLNDVLINLIKKQQKEIETLKESQLVLYDKEGNIIACIKLGKDVVSKDKIREKIKELERQEDWYREKNSLDELYGRIDELKELLGE
jgi:formyltetrahydrofolate synthetase